MTESAPKSLPASRELGSSERANEFAVGPVALASVTHIEAMTNPVGERLSARRVYTLISMRREMRMVSRSSWAERLSFPGFAVGTGAGCVEASEASVVLEMPDRAENAEVPAGGGGGWGTTK
jgi:hypothetical protein